jgi:hypothetical protein
MTTVQGLLRAFDETMGQVRQVQAALGEVGADVDAELVAARGLGFPQAITNLAQAKTEVEAAVARIADIVGNVERARLATVALAEPG